MNPNLDAVSWSNDLCCRLFFTAVHAFIRPPSHRIAALTNPNQRRQRFDYHDPENPDFLHENADYRRAVRELSKMLITYPHTRAGEFGAAHYGMVGDDRWDPDEIVRDKSIYKHGGVSMAARLLGVTTATVSRWVDPEYEKHPTPMGLYSALEHQRNLERSLTEEDGVIETPLFPYDTAFYDSLDPFIGTECCPFDVVTSDAMPTPVTRQTIWRVPSRRAC
jgi:hypothetical protein